MNKSTKTYIIFLISAFIAIWTPQYVISFETRSNLIESCERSNGGIRTPLFNFLVDAEQSRRSQAKITKGNEKRVNLRTAKSYFMGRELMLQSVDPYLRLNKNRPEVDCKKAFPLPFPFS